jgi:predicted nucleic acid-binding protein
MFIIILDLKMKRPRLKSIANTNVDMVIHHKISGKKNKCEAIIERMNEKSKPFITLALKPAPQKN